MTTLTMDEPSTSATPRPLSGIRVVDFTQLIAGPSATTGLRELGADVIKVERPVGDLARSIGGQTGYPPTFAAYNSGKRSVAIDLSTDLGRDAIRRVIAQSDVVVQAFRPGAMKRLGLDYEALSQQHPELIYVSLSAYNPNGAGGKRAGVDSVVQGESGIMSITGDPDGEPAKVGFQVIDAATGLAIGQAVLASLLHRHRTGRGTSVELSLFEVAAYLQSPAFATASRTGNDVVRPGNASGALGAPSDRYRVADGHMMIAAYFPDQWVKFCQAIGAPQLADDERYLTNADRIRNNDELGDELAPILARRTRREWAQIFTDAGVIAGPVYTHLEILDDAELRSLGRFRRIDDGVTEEHWLPELPYSSVGWAPPEQGSPPVLGEHTTDVLAEAGLTPQEIAHLQEEGVLGSTAAAGW